MLTLSHAPFNSEYILIVLFEQNRGGGCAGYDTIPAEGVL